MNVPSHARETPVEMCLNVVHLQQAGLYLRERITDAIAQVDEKLALDDIAEMDEVEKASMQKLIRETLHQCYNFGFEVKGPVHCSAVFQRFCSLTV